MGTGVSPPLLPPEIRGEGSGVRGQTGIDAVVGLTPDPSPLTPHVGHLQNCRQEVSLTGAQGHGISAKGDQALG